MTKHTALVVHEERPFNAEPPLELLRAAPVTPTELFYVRNHGDVPAVDTSSYRLAVDGLVERPLELSLREIRNRFPPVRVAATLSCAGNRRAQLAAVAPIPGELPWRDGAIGTGIWTGVRLRDVLAAAGVARGAEHVAFEGLDEAVEVAERPRFGASIPVAKALAPETILAYELNGEPLPPEHGFPVRVVVPGYIGARSVKWVARVTAAREPSSNYFQTRAYKLFPPDVAPDKIDWASGTELGPVFVNSAICRPAAGAVVPAGAVEVEGWAIGAGGESVERVEVSPDGGATWTRAHLVTDPDPWTWRFWHATVDLPPGEHALVVRAVDSAGNAQPPDPKGTWNAKGYANNAWHRVRVTVAAR